MQCAMIRVFFCAGNYLRQLFFRSKILLKSRRFQDSKIPGFKDSRISRFQDFKFHVLQLTYRNHLLEQYNSTYISTYVVVQCRLYTPAKYFISNVDS